MRHVAWHIPSQTLNYQLLYLKSILEICFLYIDGIILDEARCILLGTGQHAEAAYVVFLTQVDDYLMREGGVVHRLPEGALLQVKYLVGRTVAAAGLFAVCIDNLPVLARNGLAVGVEQTSLPASRCPA